MNKVFVIAEAGVNHNGSLEIARQLVDVASEAGADAVKFQTFKAERLVCKEALKATYQITNSGNTESQYQMLRKLELTVQMHKELIQYCKKKSILFLSTPFDIESIKLLADLDMPIFKVPSGEITNLPYLREIAKQKRKIILSTGMSTLDEVKKAVNVLKEYGEEDITLLHCNTQYPTPISDVNLLAMVTMQRELGLPVGYSDHTQGIEIPLAATALGACVIEKHFTLNRAMEGPDHKASLEPQELKEMVNGIRKIECALGSGKKQVSLSEYENIEIVRKSIVAACNIRKNDIFTDENLAVKRPGSGISPMRWDEIIGMKANKDYVTDEMIQI